MIYECQTISKTLPNCSYSLESLSALLLKAKKLHTECANAWASSVHEKKTFIKDIDPDNIGKIREYLDENFHYMIDINGADGEYISIINTDDLSNLELPNRILNLRFTNLFSYEYKTSQMPDYGFEIKLDFKTPLIFDLISSPTKAPDNSSYYSVRGVNGIIVQGITSEFEKFFEDKRNFRHFINANNAYDLYLWILFLPTFVALTFKYENLIPPSITNSPSVVQSILAIAIFFEVLLVFRFIFNLARWLFPIQELSSQTSRHRKVAKYLYGVIMAGLIGTLSFNLLSFFWEKLVD